MVLGEDARQHPRNSHNIGAKLMKTKVSALTLLLLLGACDGDDEHEQGHEEQQQQPVESDEALKALQAKLDALAGEKQELTSRVTELEQDLSAAREQLSAAEAQVTKGDADAKAQAQIAAAEQTRLEGELAKAKAALDEANAKLQEGDHEQAAAALAAARAELADLKESIATAAGTLSLNVALRYGNAAFALDQAYPVTGGTLSFTSLRYWLSNLTLVKADGSKVKVPNSYYLMGAMNAEKLTNGVEGVKEGKLTIPASRRELVSLTNVPPGVYRAIEAQVGVDPEHNDDLTIGGGELNILRNMTADNGWMWFTSWIFTRAHGTFTPAAAPSTPVGVRWENGTNDDLRNVQIALPSDVRVDLAHKPQVNIQLDVAKLLTGLDPASAPVIEASHAANRKTLADNWAGAFSFGSVATPAQ